MDVSLINPFLVGTVDVLKTMCFVTPEKGKPFLRKPNEAASGSITGIMGIVGKLTGTIAVSFEEKVALDVVSKFLGEIQSEINEDVVDAVGELTNMISGAAKKMFSDQGKSFKIAIPTVVSGSPHQIHHIKDIACVVLPFVLPSGKFFVEASIKQE
ncbi:chemotaxis protein CheX [Candidatus Auribacterota bacterium]